VIRVHQLLKFGYDRLVSSDYSCTDEPSLTQVLVQSMDNVLIEPPSEIEDWSDFFHVSDDPPENTGGRTGKRRKRVDVRVSTGQRPRQHFRFEAKRLNSSASTAEYVGTEGLGCFVSDEYAAEDDDAGMLGYVQSNDEQIWAERLKDRITADSVRLRVTKDGHWKPHSLPGAHPHLYRTRHMRDSGREISILHTLLRFH
jgi:hypothetical protein